MSFLQFSSPVLVARMNNAGPLEIVRSDPKEQNATGGWETKRKFSVVFDPATVHTINGRILDQVADADRNTETIRVYVTARVFASDGGRDADRVIYRDRCFRVVVVDDYGLAGAVFIADAQLEEPAP